MSGWVGKAVDHGEWVLAAAPPVELADDVMRHADAAGGFHVRVLPGGRVRLQWGREPMVMEAFDLPAAAGEIVRGRLLLRQVAKHAERLYQIAGEIRAGCYDTRTASGLVGMAAGDLEEAADPQPREPAPDCGICGDGGCPSCEPRRIL